MNQLTVTKCGIKFYPPSIVIIYYQPSEFGTKRRIRKIPARNLNKNSLAEVTAKNLKSSEKHNKYLDQVPQWQLEKLIRMLKENMQGRSKDEILREAKQRLSLNPNEDLNKVDEQTLRTKKALMNKSFEENRKKLGDVDFEYDVVVDFDIGNEIESNDWDDSSEMDPL